MGHDRLDGGTGNDVPTGGKDADVFVFGFSGGKDQITDFDPEDGDRLQISSSLWMSPLSAAEVVAKYATLTGDTITLSFSTTNKLQLDHVNDLAQLADWIAVV